jgi:signal transduction histidine kinase
VPDEVKRKLFTRFERGMARESGQGLGLFIVRTLVERYGGKVRVEDRVPGRPEEGAASGSRSGRQVTVRKRRQRGRS